MNVSEELLKFQVGSKEHVFFEKVLSKLGPNFVRKSVTDRLRETHNDLNKAKQKYFEWHILANAVIKSAEQMETSQDTAQSCSNVNELSSKDIHPLYLNIVQKYLPSADSKHVSSKLEPFGLNQENTLKAVENMKEVKTVLFKKLVEDNIKNFCIKIAQCTCTGENVFLDSEWEKVFDTSMKNLESKVILLSSEESKEQSTKKLREMIKTYIKELSEGVSMLNKLLSLHEQNLEFESNLAEFYLYRCQAISLKVKLFEMKILEATYNQETIPALKKISAQLEQSEHKLKEKENENTVALEQYLKLGSEYEHFVDEYTNLTKSIKEQQWAIDELKQRVKSQYESSHDI